MANEQRFIDANELKHRFDEREADDIELYGGVHIVECFPADDAKEIVDQMPTVDAVEVPDKELLKAINLLIKQYEHSKNSDYVHHPVAHAFFHTWKQLDGGRE